MGTRVSIPTTTATPGLAGSPVADTYLRGLQPMQGSVDSLGLLGGLTQTSLQTARSGVDIATQSPLSGVETSLNNNNNLLGGNLGTAVQYGPPRTSQRMSGLSGSVAGISSNYTRAFDAAKGAVSGTNGVIALALMAACLLIAALLQGGIAKLTAAALRMQRTMLAKLDSIRKQTVALVQKAINAAMEVLPDCPQSIKDVIQDLRSILGKSSTIVAAINRVLREVAACAAIGVAGASLLSSSNSSSSSSSSSSTPGVISRVTTNSRTLASYDMTTLKSGYGTAINESKDTIANNRGYYAEGNYLKVEVLERIQAALAAAEKAKLEVEALIQDSIDHDSSGTPDDIRYREALERVLALLNKIIADLELAEASLLDTTLETIETMTNIANNALTTLQSNLEKETDAIAESVDEIFANLETIAVEFESPAVQDKLATACAETQFRVILDEE